MRKILCILCVCLAAGLFAACGRSALPALPERTTAVRPTVVEFDLIPDDQKTTAEATTEAEEDALKRPQFYGLQQPERMSVRQKLFYEKLRSDSWIEVDADMECTLRAEFLDDGSLKVQSGCGEEKWEEVCDAEKSSWCYDRLRYGAFAFEDMDYDDCIHLIEDGAITYHRVMVRESAYTKSRAFADALKDTRWESEWFEKYGISEVSIDDFDVIPINETTVHLVYHDRVDDDHTAMATVKKTDSRNKLDVSVIRIYSVSGYCPETVWIPDLWTRV